MSALQYEYAIIKHEEVKLSPCSLHTVSASAQTIKENNFVFRREIERTKASGILRMSGEAQYNAFGGAAQ